MTTRVSTCAGEGVGLLARVAPVTCHGSQGVPKLAPEALHLEVAGEETIACAEDKCLVSHCSGVVSSAPPSKQQGNGWEDLP